MKQATETAVAPKTERAEPRPYVCPEVDIFEDDAGYILQAEMPGVNKNGLEVTIEGNSLTLVGRRAPNTSHGEVLMGERTRPDFMRVFELDPAIDAAKINAQINQGLLTLRLPKSERVKPRRIAVEGN